MLLSAFKYKKAVQSDCDRFRQKKWSSRFELLGAETQAKEISFHFFVFSYMEEDVHGLQIPNLIH